MATDKNHCSNSSSQNFKRSFQEDLERQWQSTDCDYTNEIRLIPLAGLSSSRCISVPPSGVKVAHASIHSSSASTLDENKLPAQKYPYLWSKFRWSWMSVYVRLNVLVGTVNVIAIIVLAAEGKLLTQSPANISAAVAANILTAVLMRQELVVNLLFAIAGCCPQWMPMRVRRLIAKIYHFGGIHSGSAISSVIWFAILNIVVVRALGTAEFSELKVAILTMTVILDFLFLSIVMLSYPRIRSKFHNTWECVHRYAGWTAIGLIWVHFGLLTHAVRDMESPDEGIGTMLVKQPVFWMLFVITMCLIFPWLWLRKVSVRSEKLSNHATRLHFCYTNLPLCAAPRVTDSPLIEWHAFAGIPEEDGEGFSLIVSKAGDWTSRIIQAEPTKLWVRGLPVRGVLHIAPIFKSMLLVATGSGIGPVMSLLVTAKNLHCRILWSTKEPISTYGQKIVDRVKQSDPRAVIIDTKPGRPDMVKETLKIYQESRVEAVFCISNPDLTKEIQFTLESRGIPVFAPIFDS